MAEHGVTPAAVRRLWEGRVPGLEMDWDSLLDVNHDLLHTLGEGRVARGPETG